MMLQNCADCCSISNRVVLPCVWILRKPTSRRTSSELSAAATWQRQPPAASRAAARIQYICLQIHGGCKRKPREQIRPSGNLSLQHWNNKASRSPPPLEPPAGVPSERLWKITVTVSPFQNMSKDTQEVTKTTDRKSRERNTSVPHMTHFRG